MANLRDSAVVAQDALTQVKFWHTVYGLLLWEFFTTLDYEWKVFRGHIPYRWTIWVYSITRVAGLVGAIICIFGMDITTPIHCQPWITFLLISSYLSLAAASLLIVLRIIAIWNRHKVATAMAVSTWGINVAFLIQGTARLHSKWLSDESSCMVVDTPSNTASLISMAVTDIILLLIMLVGLLRLRFHSGGTFGLARLLLKQGVIWILLATVVEVPPAILLILDLNDRLNLMFQAPAVVTMTIASTRMHRSLVDSASSSDVVQESFQVSKLKFATPKQSRATPAPLSLTETTVPTVLEQHLTPQLGDRDPSINTDDKVLENRTESSPGEDLERGK